MNHAPTKAKLHGLMAGFTTPEAVVAAAEAAHAAGYRKMDAYSPFPIHGLAEAIGFKRNRMAPIVFVGGLLGFLTAYFLQWYTSVVDYPIIVAGKPYHSWPSFIPITFELTVLGAASAAVFGMLGINGLPRPHHPVFNAPGFERASKDRFFLCIESGDPKFDPTETRRFLETLHPYEVSDVEP
jgi:hypothetical protein